jgi:hypothetical protein
MSGDGSATGGCGQQHNARYLTATPSGAGRLPPPPPCSVTSCLLDFYHECVDNGGWALYDAREGLEKLTIIRRIPPPPAPNTAALPAKHKSGCQASERRRAHDRRRARDKTRREVWAESRRHRSQSCLHTPSFIAEVISAMAEPATAEPATPSAAGLTTSATLSVAPAGPVIAGAVTAADTAITAASTPSAETGKNTQ